MHLFLQKGFIINKIPNNNYSPIKLPFPTVDSKEGEGKNDLPIKDHMVIASFVGNKPLPLAFSS
jgi:hypothetical protein